MPPKRKADAAGLPARTAAQVKRWCFTVFDAAACADATSLLNFLAPSVAYACYQRELAPGTGRPHLQGYLVLHTKARLGGVKTLLRDNTAHCEPARGSNEEASAYCHKDDTRDPAEGSGPFECGILPKDGAGARNDLNRAKALLDSGHSDKDLADDDFGVWCRNYKAFTEYRLLSSAPRRHQTELIVYWGPPGTGKTRAASFYDDESRTFWLPRPSGSSVWWDGYEGHRTVVLDEFYGWLRRDAMQRLVDRTPLRVERKGGSVNFTARTIIITSNTPPDLWWKKVGLGAMERRLAEPIGAVVYVGNAAFPSAAAYRASLEPVSQPLYYASSDDVPLGHGAVPLGAGPGQF